MNIQRFRYLTVAQVKQNAINQNENICQKFEKWPKSRGLISVIYKGLILCD